LLEVNFKEIRNLIRIYTEVSRKEPEYLFFDEIQNVFNWELSLREILDLNKYKIFITDSSSKLLSKEIGTSLRGRTLTYSLLTFSVSEFLKSKNTLYDYIDKIQDSVSVFFLPKYSEKIYVRERWPNKVYFCDLGISKVSRFISDIGKLMENCVFLQLLRKKNIDPLVEIYYYKNGRYEVDFLLKKGIEIIDLIQVCYDISDLDAKKREINALIKSDKHSKCKNLLVITYDYENEEIIENKKVKYIPLGRWLLSV
jgi:predicted AAA+ superfamily ATPase